MEAHASYVTAVLRTWSAHLESYGLNLFCFACTTVPIFIPHDQMVVHSGEGGSKPSSSPYHCRYDSCRPTTTTPPGGGGPRWLTVRPADPLGLDQRRGGFGTRPRYLIVCLWRHLLVSHHCSF